MAQWLVVAPHGVLFRGAAEGTIREYLIKELNYLDAVIGLPPTFFMALQFQPAFWCLRNVASATITLCLSMPAATTII
jgi:type I restriction-modification system DNA methylase subunit